MEAFLMWPVENLRAIIAVGLMVAYALLALALLATLIAILFYRKGDGSV